MLDSSQFTFISESDINILADYLDSIGQPVKLSNLRREFIRHRLNESEIQYWTPEKAFVTGDDIIVLLRNNEDDSIVQRKGKVISIQKNCRDDLGLDGPRFRYDKICVKCDLERHYYIANCPELSSFIEQSIYNKEESIKEFPLTVDTLSFTLANTLDPILINELLKDYRFVHFNNEWCLQSLLSSFIIRKEVIEKARKALFCARRPLTMKEILTETDLIESDNIELIKFLLCLNLEKDKLFCCFTEDDEIFLNIASPPSRAVNKVESYTIEKGIIRVTLGVRKLLVNIGIHTQNSPIPIRIKGNYLVHGVFDGDSHIQSGEIAEWMKETSLIPGDHIFLAIDEDQSSLRLYSQYDVEKRDYPIDLIEPIEEIEPDLESIAIRDKIYIVLKNAKSFLHYKHIHSEIIRKFRGSEKPQSIAATLSINRQMFCQGYRTLWGLVEWQGEEYSPDRTAIIFAAQEDDLVYQLLVKNEQPLSYDDLCRSIAEYFCLSKSTIRSSDVLNSDDKRIIRLLDGRFALSEWIGQWQLHKSNLEKEKQSLEVSGEYIWVIKQNIEEEKNHIDQRTLIISTLQSEIASFDNDQQSVLQQRALITRRLEAISLRTRMFLWIGNFLTIISLCVVVISQTFSVFPGMFLLLGFVSYMYLWSLIRARNELHSNMDVYGKEMEVKSKAIDDLNGKVIDNQKDLQTIMTALANHKNELDKLKNEIQDINLSEIIKEIQNLEDLLQLVS